MVEWSVGVDGGSGGGVEVGVRGNGMGCNRHPVFMTTVTWRVSKKVRA